MLGQGKAKERKKVTSFGGKNGVKKGYLTPRTAKKHKRGELDSEGKTDITTRRREENMPGGISG